MNPMIAIMLQLTVVQAKHVILFMYFSIKKERRKQKKPNALNIVFLSFSFPSGYSSIIHTHAHSRNTVFGYEMLCHVVSCR